VIRTLVLVPVLLHAFLTGTVAQTVDPSELRGTVTAQTNDVVVGAVVTIRDGAGQTSATRTDQAGNYVFTLLPPGTYTVTIAAEGFKEFSANIRLRPRQAASLNAELNVAFSTSMDVTEVTDRPGPSRRDPKHNVSSMTLTGREIATLPDDPTQFLERLIQLAGGARPGDVVLYVDGFREYKLFPPKDLIQMIRINSNPFSAEFSDRSLRRIEITTKPGSDTFHGELKFQGRSSALDARNPFADTKPTMRYLNYSGYLQGPVAKDHVAFLAYGGLWQQDENAVVHATVLDAARSLAQPFVTTVPTPLRERAVLLKTDFKASNQLVNATYARTTDTRGNQGLEGGFGLPENAFDSSSIDDVVRTWWTWLGRRWFNDMRVEINRHTDRSTARLIAPAVRVLDAFNAGGNQNTNTQRTTEGLQAIDSMTLQTGTHTWKAGAQFISARRESVDRSGFGGTFTFGAGVERDADGVPILDPSGQPISISPIENYRRTLLGLPGYHPSQFLIVTGDPQVELVQWNLAWFVLDDWVISKRLSLSYGIRQELQNNIEMEPRRTLAPRGYLSWLVDSEGKNAIKVGVGAFYTPVDPDITFETRRLDGTRQRQLVIDEPDFFSTVPTSLAGLSAIEPTVYTKSPDLAMPRAYRGRIAYERQLSATLWGVIQYDYSNGGNLLLSRNINAPIPWSNGPIKPPAFQYESIGRSSEHELLVGLRGSIGQNTVVANYTFGQRYGNTDGAATLPANSYDLSAEWGPLSNDRRHDFVAGANLALPHGVFLSPFITFTSGRPFNITTGRDDNTDSVFTDRPAFANPGDRNAIATPYGLFNPNPQPGDPIIPRNFGREPSQTTVNLAVSKTFQKAIAISLSVENLMNAARLYGTNGVITSPTFGLPNLALNGRRFELGVRYNF
jgi:Carboxypeptidase regulatory-like domain